MKIFTYPDLPDNFFDFNEQSNVTEVVNQILKDIRRKGNQGLLKYSKKFDGFLPDKLILQKSELEPYVENLDIIEREALLEMKKRVEYFARRQLDQLRNFTVEIEQGVFLGQRVLPLESVGIYVPGGNFPLVSTVLMCGIPAKVAEVQRVVMATPPAKNNLMNPKIAAAAYLAGIDEVVLAGGAQAIGVLAYGTETIAPVSKIVGPGNKYVAEAKRQVYGRVGIDFIAGPTEVFIIADKTANPSFIAADLLAQAEHDVNASAIMVTNSESLIERVIHEIKQQVNNLPTKEIANISLRENGVIILVKSLFDAVKLANKKAPEHLELQVQNPEKFIPHLENYGSLFVGEYAAEVLGDYTAGINHTLPTSGVSKYSGGLSALDFVKVTTTLKCTVEGFNKISYSSEKLAIMEGLYGHARAIRVRKNS
jgi:histidinol dehydrogenase